MLLNIQKNPHELLSFLKTISVFNFAQPQLSCILIDFCHFRSVYTEYNRREYFCIFPSSSNKPHLHSHSAICLRFDSEKKQMYFPFI